MGLGVKINSNQFNDVTAAIVLQEVSKAFRHYTPWAIEDGATRGVASFLDREACNLWPRV